MPEPIGNQNPQNPDPELSAEEIEKLTTADKLQGADPTEVAEKNKRLYARLQKEKEAKAKVEEDLRLAKEKLVALEKPPTQAAPSTPQPQGLTVDDFLGFKAAGLSDAEVKTLVDKAKSLGILPQKFIESKDIFDPWLESNRAKAKAEQNTPSPSFGGFTSKGKSWDDKNLTDDERREMFNTMASGGFKNQNL